MLTMRRRAGSMRKSTKAAAARMPRNAHFVVVSKEFEELVPAFLENRRNDARALRVLLQSDDLEGLRLLGDRIRGVSGSYGFVRIATIARLIEDAAKIGNRSALHVLIAQYDEHVAQVELAFE